MGAIKIKYHAYISRRLKSSDFVTNDLMKLLNECIVDRGETPSDYTSILKP